MGSGGPRGLQILRSGVSVRGGFDSHAFPPILAVAFAALLSLLPASEATAGREVTVGVQASAAARDSTAAAPDSIAGIAAPSAASASDTVSSRSPSLPAVPESLATAAPPRPRRTLPRPGRFDQPRWVLLRSLLVPGWGQVHNRAWIKAALVMAGDGALRVRFFRDERRLNDLNGLASDRLSELESADRTLTAAQAELAAAEAEVPPNPARIAAAQAAVAAANNARVGASDAYNGAVLAYNAMLDTSINRRWLVGGVVLYALIDAYVDAHFKNFDVNLQFDPALPGGNGTPGARLQIRWAF